MKHLKKNALKHLLLKKDFDLDTRPPSSPGANFQRMVIVSVDSHYGLSFYVLLGLQNFLQNLKLRHDEKPCTW